MDTATDRMYVVGGIDTHKDTHHAALVDTNGQRIADRAFLADDKGYRDLLTWMESKGDILAIGIECTQTYGSGIAECARKRTYKVIEARFTDRESRRRRGRDDASDAYQAALATLNGTNSSEAKAPDGYVLALRATKTYHDITTKSCTAAKNALLGMVVTAPEAIRATLRGLSTKRTVQACAAMRPGKAGGPQGLYKQALHDLAKSILSLEKNIAQSERSIDKLTRAIAPKTRQRTGAGPQSTAQLILTASSNIDRFSGEAAFSMLCGTSPIPASSGKTQRHRLNRGGDRAANSALYHIALTRMRYDEKTQGFIADRVAQGKTKREAMRSLKRYLARELFYSLRADLEAFGSKDVSGYKSMS